MSIGWHVLRFIIEAQSPISCTTGNQGFNDTQLARDANGLPIIPGSTLQGVFKSFCDEATSNAMFGWFEDGTDGKKGVAHSGRLFFSNALVLGSDGKCAGPNQIINKIGAADIFTQLLEDAPLKREHVRINELGAADGSGKYDRSAVPKGTRFAFEVMMAGTVEEKDRLIKVFEPLKSPFLRFGGRGRRGYGKVGLVKARYKFFPKTDWKKYRELRDTVPSNIIGLADIEAEISDPKHNAVCITVKLQNINPWRTGHDGVRTRTGKQQGLDESRGDPRDRDADMAPTRDPHIDWVDYNNVGRWCEPAAENQIGYVLAGTSIAGALLHRAIFHHNRENDRLIDDDTTGEQFDLILQDQKQLKCLFGEAADEQSGNEGLASALFVDDIYLGVPNRHGIIVVDHIGINAFEGGVHQGHNFAEELILQSKFDLTIWVDQSRWPDVATEEYKQAVDAFGSAISQLCSAGLSLGTKSSGIFQLADSLTPLSVNGFNADAWKLAFANAAENTKLLEPTL